MASKKEQESDIMSRVKDLIAVKVLISDEEKKKLFSDLRVKMDEIANSNGTLTEEQMGTIIAVSTLAKNMITSMEELVWATKQQIPAYHRSEHINMAMFKAGQSAVKFAAAITGTDVKKENTST